MLKRLKASANVIKPSVFVPDRPFQTSLMFERKGEQEPSQVEQLLLVLL
jgi:hypothetical protein